MFTHYRQGKAFSTTSLKTITPFQTPEAILSEGKRTERLQHIQSLCAFDEARYESLCQYLIHNLVKHCQLLPESDHNYYSQPGGILDYALSRTEVSLSIFRQFVLLGNEETWSEEQMLWQYALFSASLLQGLGKLYSDYSVQILDHKHKILSSWNPLITYLNAQGHAYAYEWMRTSEPEFRQNLNILMAWFLMPPSGFSWIASDAEVLAVWLALLEEDYYRAGTLGAILIRADAIALQRYFKELVTEDDFSKIIRWQQHRPSAFGGGKVVETEQLEQKIGVIFLQWVIKSLEEGQMMINKIPLFSVPGGMLLPPEIFKLFIREHPEFKNWLLIRKGLLSLGLHRPGQNDEHHFQAEKKNKLQTGIVLDHYAVLLPDHVLLYQKTNEKPLSMNAVDFIYQMPAHYHLSETSLPLAAEPPRILSVEGKWLAIKEETDAAPVLGH